ncbi:MAG TPA: ABC transporter ATP-binding protein [Gammaproteobacteria bacterium]|nr:ABC transporter ATP-binding protein [Gammaproteobacteria bacterium]
MNTALSIHQLKKTYANSFEALKGIDLSVEAGDFFALLGPNGAGKSTTIGIICSLINKSSGKVKVFDNDIDNELSAAKSCIGLVPQEFNFNVFEPIEEIVINQAGYYGIERHEASIRAEKLLKQLGLWDKRRDMARTLSGGMKRRLMIARALVHQPRLLILDEPTAGVDIEIRHSMWMFLREINKQGTTIILTTHYLEEAENLCNNIAIIDGGEIIENTSIKHLLSQLNVETFILDVTSKLETLPVIPNYECRLVDSTQIEAQVKKGQDINELFAILSQHKIKIFSMRNKVNRLEELFMNLLNKAN